MQWLSFTITACRVSTLHGVGLDPCLRLRSVVGECGAGGEIINGQWPDSGLDLKVTYFSLKLKLKIRRQHMEANQNHASPLDPARLRPWKWKWPSALSKFKSSINSLPSSCCTSVPMQLPGLGKHSLSIMDCSMGLLCRPWLYEAKYSSCMRPCG